MTAEDYAPGDGTMIMIDDVHDLNLMIVTEAEGDQGILLGAVANRGFSDQSVSLSLGGDELFAGTLDAESTHLLEEGEPIIVQNVPRSEEHTSELQSRGHLVCRLLLEKKNKAQN